MLKSLQFLNLITFDDNNSEMTEETRLLKQLQNHTNQIKAYTFYFTRLKQKTLKSFQRYQSKQQQQLTLCRMFNNWKQAVKIAKLEKLLHKNVLFSRLKHNRENQLKKNIKVVQEMSADNCHEKCLKAKIFYQWIITAKIVKKQRQLDKFLKLCTFNRFILNSEALKSNKFTKNLALSINKENKLRQNFRMWVEYTKQSKVIRFITRRRLHYLLKKIKRYNEESKKTSNDYYSKKLKQLSFKKLHAFAQNQKYQRYYQKKTLAIYFKRWIKAGDILYYEKEEEIKNEQKLKEYKQRKNKVILFYSFQKWKNIAEDRKQQRRKNQLAKQFGEVKEKHHWLIKCFQHWKQLKNINKADAFYQSRLKSKIISALKDEVIRAAEKLERVYMFVQNRQKRRYFKAIQLFIQNDKKKVNKFLTNKAWNKFTLGIVKNFVTNKTKAQNYHAQSLKFKCLYVLKSQVAEKAKIHKVFIFINVNMNLKRWVRHYRVRQFVQSRNFMIKGTIFRALKLQRMGKIWSQKSSISPETEKKNIRYKNSHKKTETQFQLQKIALESPSKIFSLDYSISAYNSNNFYENM